MAQMIVQITYPGHAHPEYLKFDAQEVSIGRGFDNDIILPDEHVSARHAVLTAQENGWLVRDCGSVNGVLVSRTGRHEPESFLVSGDEIVVGRVRIRVYSSGHPVPPERLMRPDRGVFGSAKARKLIPVLYMLALCLFILQVYFSSTEKVSYEEFGTAVLTGFVVLAVWAGFWSFFARLLKGRPHFLDNLALVCGFYVFVVVAGYSVSLAAYLSNSYMLWLVSMALCGSGSFAVLLAGHLSISTRIGLVKKWAIAGSITLLFSSILALTYIGRMHKFYPYPRLFGELKPPFVRLVPGKSIDQIMAQSDSVFEKARKKTAELVAAGK